MTRLNLSYDLLDYWRELWNLYEIGCHVNSTPWEVGNDQKQTELIARRLNDLKFVDSMFHTIKFVARANTSRNSLPYGKPQRAFPVSQQPYAPLVEHILGISLLKDSQRHG